MFAPCTGDIGGIPRSDAFDSRPPSPRKIARKQSKQSSDTPSTVPFEVSASSSSLSQKGGSPAPFQKESLTKLRQLGAQHQLASGWHDESLADVARPSSPDKTDTPDLIDFDDGISAISSHTLEEMERRRQKDTVVPVVATALKEILNSPIKEDVEWKQKEFTEFPSFVADESNLYDIVKISRNESINTRKTNATEESFQKFMAQEAEYWEGEVKQDRRRTVERPSIEDRARRLRELSRSRSRSDGSVSFVAITFNTVYANVELLTISLCTYFSVVKIQVIASRLTSP